ncbi:MAG: tRNA (uridine(34)/cytosine(34)/5-carboxymethylaminomethyluridine(34)-2'-O)-methyltransferase TrmL, partial [Clostridia bacterium]|nr:tRNA (uridine(34)/cytosine(34)/5-carboxymethylaminomethyluridine(34)-2'-O)-methyltransferase TrmL [Clostridia bacterium]
QHVYSDVSFPDNSYLFFGKETKGLPEELLIKHPDRCLRLPMAETIRSLNLSNTVAIAVYEVLRQWDFPELQNMGELHNYSWKDYS